MQTKSEEPSETKLDETKEKMKTSKLQAKTTKKPSMSDIFHKSVLTIMRANSVTEKEFRKMSITVFSILFSALLLTLIYYNYVMFGDYFTGAFLAIIISIPLVHWKNSIINEFPSRITREPHLKSATNAIFIRIFNINWDSVVFLIKPEAFMNKLKLEWRNVIDGIKDLINLFLNDLIMLTLLLFSYIIITKYSIFTTVTVFIWIFLIDVIIRLMIDAFIYALKLINDKFYPLFDENDKPIPTITSAISIFLVLATVLVLVFLMIILVGFIILEIGEFQELGVSIYRYIENWIEESHIIHYFFNENEELAKTIRNLAVDYGEDLKEKLNIPINLTALTNGTNEELKNEIFRDIDLIINSTLAVNTTDLYDVETGFSMKTLNFKNIFLLIHSHLSNVM